MKVEIRPFNKRDWQAIAHIYAQGMATGIATFETEVPSFEIWNRKFLNECRLVAEIEGKVVGFAVLSLVSQREVYHGVAEVTIYVDAHYQKRSIGQKLLSDLIISSEEFGFWTLHATVFIENEASLALHKKCGFRVVGVKERIGNINGKWHDNYLLERRSLKVGL